MTLSLVPPDTEIVARIVSPPPLMPAELERTWDDVHGLMAKLNESMQTQLDTLKEMALAVRAAHDIDHDGVSWPVCPSAACKLAGPLVK